MIKTDNVKDAVNQYGNCDYHHIRDYSAIISSKLTKCLFAQSTQGIERVKNVMLAALITLCLFFGASAPAQEAIDIGSRKQLFIDDRFIAENAGITLVVNSPPRKRSCCSRKVCR